MFTYAEADAFSTVAVHGASSHRYYLVVSWFFKEVVGT